MTYLQPAPVRPRWCRDPTHQQTVHYISLLPSEFTRPTSAVLLPISIRFNVVCLALRHRFPALLQEHAAIRSRNANNQPWCASWSSHSINQSSRLTVQHNPWELNSRWIHPSRLMQAETRPTDLHAWDGARPLHRVCPDVPGGNPVPVGFKLADRAAVRPFRQQQGRFDGPAAAIGS